MASEVSHAWVGGAELIFCALLHRRLPGPAPLQNPATDPMSPTMISCLQCCGCLPQSNLPRNVVPLSESEGKVVFEALQGSWSIKAIAMSEAMQDLKGGNSHARPITFDNAVVAGMRYTMTGGGGQPHTETFKFSKSPDTGQIFLDTWGSIITTQGWPNERPMAGQEGEVVDFVAPFAAIRWTRTDGPSTAALGQVQTRQPQAATGATGGTA